MINKLDLMDIYRTVYCTPEVFIKMYHILGHNAKSKLINWFQGITETIFYDHTVKLEVSKKKSIHLEIQKYMT